MPETAVSKEIVTGIFSQIPLSIMGSLTRTTLLLPYYHMISNEDVVHVKHLYKYKTVSQFTEDLDFLLRYYSPISLHDVLNHLKAGRRFQDRVFLLTFDDGFREMSDIVAPILLKKGINATFFVNSAFLDNKCLCYLQKSSILVERLNSELRPGLERKLREILNSQSIVSDDLKLGVLSINYQKQSILDELANVMCVDWTDYITKTKPYLTSDQIHKLLKSGFSIGAHSIDHPLYSALSLEEQVTQTIESVTCIRDKFHIQYGAFAFPHTENNVTL